VFAAGLMVACRSETGGEFEIEHVFAGFKQNFAGLRDRGAHLHGRSLALLLVFALFAGFGMVMAFATGDAGRGRPSWHPASRSRSARW
jgi:hypothetical protein